MTYEQDQLLLEQDQVLMGTRDLISADFEKANEKEDLACRDEEKIRLVDFLQQQNMILTAEKETLSSEVSFYKNELAKLCILTKTSFPIFKGANSTNLSPQIKRKKLAVFQNH